MYMILAGWLLIVSVVIFVLELFKYKVTDFISQAEKVAKLYKEKNDFNNKK